MKFENTFVKIENKIFSETLKRYGFHLSNFSNIMYNINIYGKTKPEKGLSLFQVVMKIPA